MMFTHPPSLLITDDDEAFRETLQGVLEPQGLRTLLAGDGEEAVRIVRTEEVHLVLSDMHMPRLTGLETIRLLKRMNAELPCILLSADLDEVLLAQARDAKVFSVLRKPVTRVEITRIVLTALSRTYNWPGPEGEEPTGRDGADARLGRPWRGRLEWRTPNRREGLD